MSRSRGPHESTADHRDVDEAITHAGRAPPRPSFDATDQGEPPRSTRSVPSVRLVNGWAWTTPTAAAGPPGLFRLSRLTTAALAEPCSIEARLWEEAHRALGGITTTDAIADGWASVRR
jgi:hypothetical protein